jgi:hypothetical protein
MALLVLTFNDRVHNEIPLYQDSRVPSLSCVYTRLASNAVGTPSPVHLVSCQVRCTTKVKSKHPDLFELAPYSGLPLSNMVAIEPTHSHPTPVASE